MESVKKIYFDNSKNIISQLHKVKEIDNIDKEKLDNLINKINYLVSEQTKSLDNLNNINEKISHIRDNVKKIKDNPTYICNKINSAMEIILKIIKIINEYDDSFRKMINFQITNRIINKVLDMSSNLINHFMLDVAKYMKQIDKPIIKKVTISCYSIELNKNKYIIGSDVTNVYNVTTTKIKLSKIIRRFDILRKYYIEKFNALKNKINTIVGGPEQKNVSKPITKKSINSTPNSLINNTKKIAISAMNHCKNND